MLRTRQKLNEAAFFLDRVEEHAAKIETFLSDKKAVNVFSYYLSAFVSAARSTAWIMRSEKTEPLQPGYWVRFDDDGGPPIKPHERLSKGKMTISFTAEGENATSQRGVDGLTLTVDELEGEDLLENCRAYLQDLQRLVASCESHFRPALKD